MNLFDDTLLKDTFKTITTPITFNFDSDDHYTVDGFITNTTFSPNSSYHIHSLDEFKRGDYFELENDEVYLVTGDVITTRGAKYKSVADYCNFEDDVIEIIEVDTGEVDFLNRPIYDYVETLIGTTYGVIRHRAHTLNNADGIVIPYSELLLTISNNEMNRNKYKLNHEVIFEGKTYRVIEVILVRQGLIELRLESK